MKNTDLIEKFYSSFSAGNPAGMIDCYHDNILFEDPAFGKLEGEKAKAMWRMLLSRESSQLKISYSNIKVDDSRGSANWRAEYLYGLKKRKVVNHVSAHFEFQDGKIIKHTDDFDLWKWSRQALGISGYLLGWSSFLKNKIQEKTNGMLGRFMDQNPNG